jgi:peptide/nickel transport system permease protein
VTSGRFRTKLLAHRGGRAGALLLSVVALLAIFAECLASDVPLLMTSRGTVYVLPAVTHPHRFQGLRAEQIARSLDAGDLAVWPLLRSGPSSVSADPPFSAASLRHPLGTDAFGRDVLARRLYGARTSLGLGLSVALLAALAGYALGALAGLRGGLWDSLIERMVEVVGVFPAVVAIALVRSLEPTPTLLSLFLVMTAVSWAEAARVSRLLVLRSLAEPWAAAAKALGVSPFRLAVRHFGPHLAPAVSVSAAFAVATVALTETSLSFLGLGVPASVVSWGEMLGEIRWGAGPRVLMPPLLALGAVLVALYLIADAVRTAADA